VLQTAASLWDDGDLTIAGISQTHRGAAGRPTGSFGWEYGAMDSATGSSGTGCRWWRCRWYGAGERDGRRWCPATWPHAVRSDHFVFHRRNHRATGAAGREPDELLRDGGDGVAAGAVGAALGFTERTALGPGLAYAFATTAWAYSRTILSEPLSGLCSGRGGVLRDALGAGGGAGCGWPGRSRGSRCTCTRSTWCSCRARGAGGRRAAAARGDRGRAGVLRWGRGCCCSGSGCASGTRWRRGASGTTASSWRRGRGWRRR
jgi:hypothetical protein